MGLMKDPVSEHSLANFNIWETEQVILLHKRLSGMRHRFDVVMIQAGAVKKVLSGSQVPG